MYGFSKDCLILIPFRLPQISCFTLSRQLPHCGDRNPLQFTHLPRVGSVLLIVLFFPLGPSSYLLPSFAWFYIFFSTSQVLLSTLSWFSVCTSVSEGVFLMYPWREVYSMPTYSSAILFSSLLSFKVLFLIPIILRFNNSMLWCKSFFLQVIVLDAHWVVLT